MTLEERAENMLAENNVEDILFATSYNENKYISDLMAEFARETAKTKLEEASEKAKVGLLNEEGEYQSKKSFVIGGDIYAVDIESITNIKLD